MSPRESSSRPADRRRHRHSGTAHGGNPRRKKATRSKPPGAPADGSNGAKSQSLSTEALARLNRANARQRLEEERVRRPRVAERREHGSPSKPRKHPRKSQKRRVVSGVVMEEGRARNGRARNYLLSEDGSEKEMYDFKLRGQKKSRRRLWILLACSIVILIIVVVVVAVVVSKKNSEASDSQSNLDGKDRSQIPPKWQNTYLDPWSWQSTTDFNVSFTDEMIGDLPIMGLFTTWDDSKSANDKVPALDQPWGSYGAKPARGVNLGGWLSLEPFITPSLFNYAPTVGVVDEWTLVKHLGPSAAKTLEAHYATFVTEQTFRDIAAAGLDHVRIPFSYWAVQVFDDDPYIFRTSWRYLLRGIEWARRYGLRVSLDLHALPGSQNGWNHSGRSGAIGWLNGPDGQRNGKRSLEVHDKLSKFFAQERYKSVVTHYGLANEPRMVDLRTSDVVQWSREAYSLIRKNGVRALVVFGDGFMGLEKWQGLMPGHDDMVLDVHQYVIFNKDQIVFTHQKKVEYACDGWTQQAALSMDPKTGYGPTIFAEWSQADTDCAKHLTDVGRGNRWEGTYDSGSKGSPVTTPRCPAQDASCSCAKANQEVADFSDDHKTFLRMFAEAQMHSFEKGWGWWYWTWKTESAPLWSYETAWKAGILPEKAYARRFNCDADVPDFGKRGLPETY